MDAAEPNVTTIIAVSPAHGWDRRALEALAAGLAADSRVVLLLPDLYHIPDASAVWDELHSLTGPVRLITRLHPRAAEWVLRTHLPDIAQVEVNRLDDFAVPQDVLEAAGMTLDQTPRNPPEVETRWHDTPSRWYPVRDASRCTHCGHCVQFCLFGVWSRGETGEVGVTNPDACKDGCPACARICPQGAIIFPEYLDDPAICGAPGQFVELDAAARRMYYLRAAVACPVCGQTGKPRAANRGEPCPECGRRTELPLSPAPEPNPVMSDIDSLIDDLENLQDRSV